MKNHALVHMLGCAVPLLLIMILPSFGVSSNVSYFIFIVLMFGCHLFMLRGHGHEDGHKTEADHLPEKGESHGGH